MVFRRRARMPVLNFIPCLSAAPAVPLRVNQDPKGNDRDPWSPGVAAVFYDRRGDPHFFTVVP